MSYKKLSFLFAIFLFSLNFVWSETAIATTKITYADTILAKVVSEIYGYPQILLERDKLSNETIELLKALKVTEIIIIGGPAVVSQKVEEELKELGYNVIRIWGVERYETSALVAKYFWDSSEEVVLITEDLAHERANSRILSLVREAVDYAIDKKIPILITTAGNLEKNVIEALISLGVKRAYIFTLANINNIENELRELNISYTIYRVPLPKNCTPIRIGIPENALWNLSKEVLIYKKCVEIVPIRDNMTIEELRNLNISIIITNVSDAKEFREKLVYKEILEKKVKEKEKLSLVLRSRIYDIIVDIAVRLNNIPQEIRRCFLEIRKNISKIEEEEYKKVLDCLSKINEYRWKSEIFTSDFRKQIIEEIKKNLIVTYKNITLELNISRELNISDDGLWRWMPDPIEIREKLQRIIKSRILARNREGKLCIQVITCACSPFGKCAIFPTPCDVPPFWNIISCEEINKTEGRILILPPRK